MARLFDITTTSDTSSMEAGGTIKLVFTVTNTTQRPQRATLRAKALDSAQASWLSVSGDTERDFPAGFTHQVEVQTKVPAATEPTKFRLRLDALSVANPDDDYTEGPPVSITVKAADKPRPKSIPWWVWLIVGLVVLAIVGIVAWVAMSPGEAPQPVPQVSKVPADLVGQPFGDAKKHVEEAGYVVERKDSNIAEGCPGKVLATMPQPGSPAASGATVALTVGVLPYGPDTCRMGFVWRDAFNGDHVCVSGESRSRAAADNQQMAARSENVPATAKDIDEVIRALPKGTVVPKGDLIALSRLDRRFVFEPVQRIPMIVRCKAGFTERRAIPTDRICVTEATQLETAEENKQANARRACVAP